MKNFRFFLYIDLFSSNVNKNGSVLSVNKHSSLRGSDLEARSENILENITKTLKRVGGESLYEMILVSKF